MILAALKNYFQKYKYIFLITLIIGLFFGWALIFTRIVLRNESLEDNFFNELINVFSNIFVDIDISDILTGGLTAIIRTLYNNVDFTESRLRIAVIGFLIIIFVSFLIAGFVCRFFLRRGFRDENSVKGIKGITIRFLIFSGLTIIITLAAFVLPFILFLGIFFVAKNIANILEMKFIYFKNEQLFDLLRVKIIGSYLLSSFVLLIVLQILIYVLFFINFYLALIVMIPLFLYFFEIIRFTPLTFFRDKKLT